MARVAGPHRVNAGRGALGSGALKFPSSAARTSLAKKKAPRERGFSLRRNVEPENRTCGLDRHPQD
jgi:hypothetical protein